MKSTQLKKKNKLKQRQLYAKSFLTQKEKNEVNIEHIFIWRQDLTEN